MTRNTEIDAMARLIIETHNGQMYFTLTEVSKITSIGASRISHALQNAGILVKRVGTKKLVSAYGIAELMCCGRKAPIDNMSRVTAAS